MLLSEIFDQLVYGELSQVAIGGKAAGNTIAPEDYPNIISHINLALTDLHTRLPLRQEEVFIQQYDWISTYYLQSRFAVTNTASTEPVKYIIDSEYRPFLDNVLAIDQVFSEIGEVRPLNDSNAAWPVYTPRFDALQVPHADSNNALSVLYRANHPVLCCPPGGDLSTVMLELPQYLQEPLLVYVGSRIIGGIGSPESHADAARLMSKYELLLQQIQQHGLVQSDSLNHTRLEENGWV